MFWQEAEPTDVFPIRRFVSIPTARWELGIRLVGEIETDSLQHLRRDACVSLRLNGNPEIELDYFCGKDNDEWFLYCGLIAGLCTFLPEDIEPRELRRLFPHQTINPLRDDRKCVEALFGLTDILQRYDPH